MKRVWSEEKTGEELLVKKKKPGQYLVRYYVRKIFELGIGVMRADGENDSQY